MFLIALMAAALVRAAVQATIAILALSGLQRARSGIGAFLFFGGMTNFFVHVVVHCSIGGDALYGKIVDEHYFLGSHGRYVEVSAQVFRYSHIHAVSAWISLALAILGMFLMGNLKRVGITPEPNTSHGSGSRGTV